MERKFRVIKPTGRFAIKESDIFIDSSSIQINLENPKDKTPVYFVERETEDDFYFVDKNNEIIVFSNDGKSCKRIGVSQFEKTGLKVGDVISLSKMMYLLNEVSLCVYSFLQEITPAEDILKKIIKTLDNHSIVFSEDANGNNDYEEFGFVQTGFEENDFITFEEWKPTDEEIEYLKTLEKKDGQ